MMMTNLGDGDVRFRCNRQLAKGEGGPTDWLAALV